MNKLSDYMSGTSGTLPLSAIKDVPVIVGAVTFREVQFRNRETRVLEAKTVAFLRIKRRDTGEVFTVNTSAMVIMEVLKAAVAHKSLPVQATFIKPGKYWVIDSSDSVDDDVDYESPLGNDELPTEDERKSNDSVDEDPDAIPF